jgi:hypothetical protein
MARPRAFAVLRLKILLEQLRVDLAEAIALFERWARPKGLL